MDIEVSYRVHQVGNFRRPTFQYLALLKRSWHCKLKMVNYPDTRRLNVNCSRITA